MQVIKEEYNNRKNEVKEYLDFVLKQEKENNQDSQPVDIRVLKSTVVLLLYNLIESTMSSVIECIYGKLIDEEVDFDCCSDCLKAEILKNIRNYFDKKSHDTASKEFNCNRKGKLLGEYIISLTYDKDHIFSGNIDAKKIIDTAKRYGFEQPQENLYYTLFAIKNSRNDLAHGTKSFSEVGKDLSPSDLNRYYEQTVSILDIILSNVESFIINKMYLQEFNPIIPEDEY